MHFGFGRIQLRCFLSVQCLYRERASEFSRKNKQVVNNDVCEGNTYLFRTKTDDNKMSHLLYVALTRSKDHLTILISQDVESAFSRDYILAFFAQYSTSVRKIQ